MATAYRVAASLVLIVIIATAGLVIYRFQLNNTINTFRAAVVISPPTTSNSANCGSFNLSTSSDNTWINTTCTQSSLANVDIYGAAGNPGDTLLKVKTSSNTTVYSGSTTSGCLTLITNVILSPGTYNLAMHSGGGGGSCGAAIMELIATNTIITTTSSTSSTSSSTSSTTTTIPSNTVSTTFSENGLPSGARFNVTYDGLFKTAPMPLPITFTTSSGNYLFVVQNSITGNGIYIPSPSSGYLLAGSTITIIFSLTTTSTTTTTVPTTTSSSSTTTTIPAGTCGSGGGCDSGTCASGYVCTRYKLTACPADEGWTCEPT